MEQKKMQYKESARALKVKMSIHQTLKEQGPFETILNVFGESRLHEKLASVMPITLFAPTDEAFGKLPANFMTSLYANKIKLNAFLGYHILTDIVWEDDLRDMGIAKTYSGKLLNIACINNVINLDGATLVLPDIPCTNGVIHVIDAVMWPK
jgi:uncharacterized surface protein with fasciclin (FAS1) repeats